MTKASFLETKGRESPGYAHGAGEKKPKLGSGKRFEKLTKQLSGKGVRDPKAVAAAIGRKKFGKKKFQKLASKGKKHGMGPSGLGITHGCGLTHTYSPGEDREGNRHEFSGVSED